VIIIPELKDVINASKIIRSVKIYLSVQEWIRPEKKLDPTGYDKAINFPETMSDAEITEAVKEYLLLPRPTFSLGSSVRAHAWQMIGGLALFASGLSILSWLLRRTLLSSCNRQVAAGAAPDFRKFLPWSVAVGVALGVLAVGIWWARTAYQSHVEQEATAKHRAAADACVKRLPGIAPNTAPDTLPADIFDTVDACEKNPETTRAVPDHQRIACESGAIDPACNNRAHGSVVEIRGGETLKVVNVSHPPTPHEISGMKVDESSFIPAVYLGHHQTFTFTCGVFGEQGTSPTIKGSEATCP
jgi:hypothetical protein